MNNIIIFSSDTCVHCQSAKRYLSENGFTYFEKNVGTNKNFRNELIEKGFRGVPVLIIDGVEVVGFDKERIKKLLKI